MPVFCAACLTLFSAGVHADQISTRHTAFPGARITGYESGRLQFQNVSGDPDTLELTDVTQIMVDRGDAFADFNQAERFYAEGDWESALLRYKRALRFAESFWSDLAASRLTMACDLGGRIDEAVLNYIRVARGAATGPASAVRLLPERIPERRDAAVTRALEQLDAALAEGGGEDQRLALELLRYAVLRRIGDDRAAVSAVALVRMEVSESMRCLRTYAVIMSALEQRQEVHGPEDFSAIDRAIRDCPSPQLPSFLLMKGRTLLRIATTQEDIIRAAWPFMRVAAHMPGDARAAEGLLGAAEAMEKLGRTDKARELLGECLGHKRITDETRAAAERMQARLPMETP